MIKPLTVSEYAKLKNISRQAVLSKIKRGIIKAVRVGHYWLIEDSNES